MGNFWRPPINDSDSCATRHVLVQGFAKVVAGPSSSRQASDENAALPFAALTCDLT
jgi:hypothetical protein